MNPEIFRSSQPHLETNEFREKKRLLERRVEILAQKAALQREQDARDAANSGKALSAEERIEESKVFLNTQRMLAILREEELDVDQRLEQVSTASQMNSDNVWVNPENRNDSGRQRIGDDRHDQ